MSETPQTLGKYRIQGELGKGAMGVVYRGFDPALEREVAIKVMGAATLSDPELKEIRARGQGLGAATAPEYRHRVRLRL